MLTATNGMMSALRRRMNSSPGKPMSSTARGVGFAVRAMDPTMIPSITPTMVLRSSGSAFSAPIHPEGDSASGSILCPSLPSLRAPRASPEDDSILPWSKEAPSDADTSRISTSLMLAPSDVALKNYRGAVFSEIVRDHRRQSSFSPPPPPLREAPGVSGRGQRER